MPKLVFSTRGAERARQYQDELNRAGQEGKKIYDDTEMSVRQLDAATRRMLQRNESEQERYNRLIGDAQRLMDKGKITVDQYGQEVNKVNQELATSSGRFSKFKEDSDESFGAGAVSKVVAFGASIVSVSSAVAVLNEEMRSNQELVNKSEMAKLGVSETRNVVIRNMVGSSDDDISKVLKQNEELADATKVSERYINLARAEALSASGGDIAASLAATEVAAKFLRDRPDEIGGYAGSLLDLSKVTGTTDAYTNLGLMTTVGGLSRVVDPQAQAMNIPRSLIGQQAFGSTPSGAAAMFAALTTGSGDLTGARSGTAAISLAQQLRDFDYGFDTSQMTTAQRVQALQQRPQLAQQFLEDSSFEKIVQGPIEKLLTDLTSQVATSYADLQARVPDQQGLALAGRQGLDQFSLNLLEPTAERGRALGSALEQAQLRSPSALTEEERETVKGLMMHAGESALGARGYDYITGLLDEGRGLTLPGAIGALERQTESATLRGQMATARGDEIPQEERENARRLHELIDTLKEINARQLEAQEELNRKLGDSEGFVGVPR